MAWWSNRGGDDDSVNHSAIRVKPQGLLSYAMLLFPVTLRNVYMKNYYTQLGITYYFLIDSDNFPNSTPDQFLASTLSPRINDMLRDKCGT